MPPTKIAISTRRTTRTNSKTTPDELATKLVSKSTLHGTRPLLAKQPSTVTVEPSPPTTEDERTNCMRMVNLSLQNLSVVTQSGWKFALEGTKNARNASANTSKVDDATRTARKALGRLRGIAPDDIDVERAACSITGKLITLELYEEAIQFLGDMHPRLLRIAATGQSSDEIPSPLHLLSLPHPTSDDPTVLTLLITFVTHALNALLFLLLRPSPPFSVSTLVTTLQHSHSLLAWASNMKHVNILDKTRDALLTKAYTFINKACTTLSSGSRSSADPKSIFYLRIHALSCLLYTTPGTVKSATFWDQVHKACLSYARAFSSESAEEKRDSTFAACISGSLSELTRLARNLHERTFSEGRSFVQMCETWMSFAQKGDISTMDHISELMGIPCTSFSRSNHHSVAIASKPALLSSSYSVDSLAARVGALKLGDSTNATGAEPASHRTTKDAALVECAQCCGIFIKATASLDSEAPELARHAKEATDALHRYCQLVTKLDSFISPNSAHPSTASSVPNSTSHSLTVDAEVLRARGKLERAVERLRRTGLRVLDALQTQNEDSRTAAMSLLEVIATTLESSLTEDGTCFRQSSETKSTLTSLVDVLFSLARSRLLPADVESYTPTLSYIERAVVAVSAIPAGTITSEDTATFFRCISGTLHNLGGTLYTAGRLGGAVRFLKEGCVLGRRVVAMYGSTCTDQQIEENGKEKEGRQQLEEQLFRRYELLGVCHSKIGDRKLAYECFVESVRTFPYTHHLSSLSSLEPFAPSAPLTLKQLSSIVERLTYTATCELFLSPARVALSHISHAFSPESTAESTSTPVPISTFPSDPRSAAEIVGALLTHQLTMLEGIGHKDGVRGVRRHLLEELLSVYNPSWAPIQRARVLVTALGVAWRDGQGEGNASTRFDVDRMGQEALELLGQETSYSVGMASLVPQLKLSTHMWMALHAYHRLPAGVEMMHAVATYVEEACSVLDTSLYGKTVASASPRRKLAGASSGAKTTRSTYGASRRGRLGVDVVTKYSKKEKVVVGPSKSQPHKAVSLDTGEHTPCNAPTAKRPLVFFNFESVLGLIQMNVHLLGLLGLIVLKVRLLEALKRVCECQGLPAQAYSVICVDLAREFVKLGKSKRASALFNKCANALKAGEVPDEVRLQYLLGRAEVLALGDNVAASASAYRDAQSLEAAVAAEDKTMPTAKRIRMRVERLERAALACRVFAAIQYTKDNLVGALCSMLQSLRLWNRAIDALSRLAPPSPTKTASKSTESENPFEVPSKTNQNQAPSTAPAPTHSKATPTPTDALSWRLLSHLVSTLFSLAHAYHVRGSPRETLYFVQQVLDLAESTRAPAVVARACILRGEVLLGQGALNEGREALEKAASLLGGVLGIDSVDAQRLKGDYEVVCEEGHVVVEEGDGVKDREERDPREHYERAWKMLDELERKIMSFDGGRRKSSLEPVGTLVHGGQGMVVPRLSSAILRRHIWLLRNDGGIILKDLVERLMALPPSAEIKGEEHAIMGKLTLHRVYEQFRSDMFLSSLTESTVALPMGMSGEKERSLVPANRDILGALEDAEKLFWDDLALTSRRGAVAHGMRMPHFWRRGLLDASSAITLHREMLEAIPHKFTDVKADDLQWPVMTTDGSPLASTTTTTAHGEHTESPPKLPPHWTVVHITLTPDKSSMFISRLHTPSSQPLLFCVPLRGRRDTEEGDESRLMLEDALRELREIVRLSDEGTRQAVYVKSDDARARTEWWAERAALDKRLQVLLENIEFCWLGAFKTILSPPTTLSAGLVEDLRTRLEKLFKRSLPRVKRKTKLRLDDALLACFSNLSPKCRDEELEDLVYFILDLYQFHGVAIAISEVDMDQVTVDLRTVLEEHAAARRKAQVMPVQDSHTFLVLDRSLQSIPWESLPVLRGQSVSRIPSLEFLLDRVHLAAMERERDGEDKDAVIDRIRVDAHKTYYVLNPSGDLKGTEGRFSSWLKGMHKVGWEGITGRAPSEQELLSALSRKDLVIYFGHGGGEQYARSHKIRHLQRCAATMLWGCSSGALREMGEFDRIGTPYNYMVAGCPTLVANLWDVTDRDVDKFTQGVFDQLGLGREGTGQGGEGTSVVTAVARSREVCKLKSSGISSHYDIVEQLFFVVLAGHPDRSATLFTYFSFVPDPNRAT
ncbi:peptidase family C50-domain-containing protein [Boletus edulis]|nr:peptidase family C50-domain-containing protein [Boletus edulis]